jgi:hypothetical protein
LDDFIKEATGKAAYLEELWGVVHKLRFHSIVFLVSGLIVKTISSGFFISILAGKEPVGVDALAVGLRCCAFAAPLCIQQYVNYLTVTKAIAKRKILAQREIERAETLANLSKATPIDIKALEADEHLSNYGKVIPSGPVLPHQ